MIPAWLFPDFLSAVMLLLPDGLAWAKDSGSVLTAFMSGWIYTLWNVVVVGQNMPADTFPSTTVSLLGEWESTLGIIPAVGATNSQRQANITARLEATGGCSLVFIQNYVATLLGISPSAVIITEYLPFFVGIGKVDFDDVIPVSGIYTYVITIPHANGSSLAFIESEIALIAQAQTSWSVIVGS